MVVSNESGKGMQGPDFEGKLHIKNLEFILLSNGKLFLKRSKSDLYFGEKIWGVGNM